MATSFYARVDSNSAGNPALNLTGDPALLIEFVWSSPTGPTGDVVLEQNGGLPDPDSMVAIGGVEYSFTFEYTGELPTAKRDGSQQVPDQLEGEPVYLVTVHDYPTAGESTRLAFLPESNASQADMDAFGKGAIDVQALDTTPAPVPVCFVRGTLIATPDGEVPVESLKVGDRILTAQGRKTRLRWVAKSHFTQSQMLFRKNLQPVCIPKHFLGVRMPYQDLWVSPQHRIVLAGWQVELTTGQTEVFVPAKHLMGQEKFEATKWPDGVEYYHLLLDQHEVVLSNGLQSESFFAGDEALKSVAPDARAELEKVLDKHQSQDGEELQVALNTATPHEACLLRPEGPALKVVA